MPKIVIPSFIRTVILSHLSSGGAAAVSPDFTPTTGATVVLSAPVPFKCNVEKFRFHVSSVNFAGAAGTQTFSLRKGNATGSVIVALTVPLATALRGATIEASVAAADQVGAGRLVDGDTLSITNETGGTAFTTGEGIFEVVARQANQAKI